MTASRILPTILLALVLTAGSFLAGYLLMSPGNTPPVPAPPAAVAASPKTSAAAPGLVITRAVYGDLPDGGTVDVTAKVKALVSRNTLSVAATNDNFTDPAEGIVKTLRVDYTVDGKPHSKSVSENETLLIKAGPQRLLVKKAVYGDLPDGSSTDVTASVAATIQDDQLTIAASNDNFGDPASGIVKKLRVDYTFDGKDHSRTVSENETLTISNAGD
jgi:hypothetical protein